MATFVVAVRLFNRAPAKVVTAMKHGDNNLYARTKTKAILDMDAHQKEMALAASEVSDPNLRAPLQQMSTVARTHISGFKDLIDAIDSGDAAAAKKAQTAMRRATAQRQQLAFKFLDIAEREYGLDRSKLHF